MLLQVFILKESAMNFSAQTAKLKCVFSNKKRWAATGPVVLQFAGFTWGIIPPAPNLWTIGATAGIRKKKHNHRVRTHLDRKKIHSSLPVDGFMHICRSYLAYPNFSTIKMLKRLHEKNAPSKWHPALQKSQPKGAWYLSDIFSYADPVKRATAQWSARYLAVSARREGAEKDAHLLGEVSDCQLGQKVVLKSIKSIKSFPVASSTGKPREIDSVTSSRPFPVISISNHPVWGGRIMFCDGPWPQKTPPDHRPCSACETQGQKP